MFGLEEVTEEEVAAFEKKNNARSDKKFAYEKPRVAFKDRFKVLKPGGDTPLFFLDPADPNEITPEMSLALFKIGITLAANKPTSTGLYEGVKGYEISWATKTRSGGWNWSNRLPRANSPYFTLAPHTRLQMLKNTGGWKVMGKAIVEAGDDMELAKRIYCEPDQGTYRSLMSEANYDRHVDLVQPNGYKWEDPVAGVFSAKGPDGKPRFKCKPSYQPVHYCTVVDPQDTTYKFKNDEGEEITLGGKNRLCLYAVPNKDFAKMSALINPSDAIKRVKRFQGLSGMVGSAQRGTDQMSPGIGDLSCCGAIEDMDEVREMNADALITLNADVIEARLKANNNFLHHMNFAVTGVSTPVKILAEELAIVLGCNEQDKEFFHPANYFELTMPKTPQYYRTVFKDQLEQLEGGASSIPSAPMPFGAAFKPEFA